MVKEIKISAFLCEFGGKRCGVFYEQEDAKEHEIKHRNLLQSLERINIRDLLSQLSLHEFSFQSDSIDWNHEIEEHKIPRVVTNYFSQMPFSTVGVSVTKRGGWYWFQFGPLIAVLPSEEELPHWEVTLRGPQTARLRGYVTTIHKDRSDLSFKARFGLLQSLARIAFQKQLDTKEKTAKIPLPPQKTFQIESDTYST